MHNYTPQSGPLSISKATLSSSKGCLISALKLNLYFSILFLIFLSKLSVESICILAKLLFIFLPLKSTNSTEFFYLKAFALI